MSKVRFSRKLHHTFINEDGDLEREILPRRANHLLAVAGSGSRLAHFLEKRPSKLTLIDISQEQLWLCELRTELIRDLSFSEYLAFWGIGTMSYSPKRRKEVFEQLSLEGECKTFLRNVFEEHGWESIIGVGRLERTFAKSAAMVRRFMGDGFVEKIFSFKSRDEQLTYLENGFPWSRWNLLLRFCAAFMFLGGVLGAKRFPKLNVDSSYYQFLKTSLDRCFRVRPARENFFLQIVILGRVEFFEALPPEFRSQVFDSAKTALRECEVELVQGNIVEWSRGYKDEFDAIYCSDLPSFLSDVIEREWLSRLRPALRDGGKIIARYYQHMPGRIDAGGYLNVNHMYRECYERENTQLYRFDVWQKVDACSGQGKTG